MAPWFERWLWHAWCWHFSPDVIRGSCTKRVKNMYHLTVLFCPRWHVCLGTPFRKVQTEGIRFWVCGWRYFCSFCSCPCTFWVHAWFHHSRYLLVCLKFSCRVCVLCIVAVMRSWCMLVTPAWGFFGRVGLPVDVILILVMTVTCS